MSLYETHNTRKLLTMCYTALHHYYFSVKVFAIYLKQFYVIFWFNRIHAYYAHGSSRSVAAYIGIRPTP